MRKNLAVIPYGNAETGDEVDTFWLKGPLKISDVAKRVQLGKASLKMLGIL